jgi:hypothetical protein
MRSASSICLALLGLVLFVPSRIHAQTTIPLNSQATYLLTYSDPNALGAPPINLSLLGLHAGDMITLQVTGDLAYCRFVSCAPLNNEIPPFQAAGVFSSTTELDSADLLNRVPGAIASNGPPINTGNTYFGSFSTDIPQDFQIGVTGRSSPTVLTIPTGANFLFAVVVDGFYGDNGDANGDLALTIGKVGQPLGLPTPFSAFSASLELSGGTGPAFEVNTKFRLGASSDGINPLTEPVVFQVGSFLAIVPPGSFTTNTDGSFLFTGIISGVNLKIQIRSLVNGGFAFRAEGRGVNLTWRELAGADPVSVGLAIGNDTGVTPLSAED